MHCMTHYLVKDKKIMDYYGNDGNKYTILDRFDHGGEGDLHNVQGHPKLAAKIYHADKRGGRRGRWAKVESWTKMASTIGDTFLDQVVIPRVALYDSPSMDLNSFAGYLMEKLSSFATLDKIYEENSIDYTKKVWIARNLCILTKQIHLNGNVVGDYNPNNVAVFTHNGTAKFIDTDSFQLVVTWNGVDRLCPCTVGVEHYLAPEIQNRLRAERANLETVNQSISNPLFNEYTDRYAMAYHIFALLMNGTAPYAGMIDMQELAKHKSHTVSDVDINALEASRRGEFLFCKNVLFKKIPEYAPKYQILSPKLQKLFERAFVDGATDPKARPDESEFYNALMEYYNSLEQCECGRDHYLSSVYNGKCEWCRIDEILKALAQ